MRLTKSGGMHPFCTTIPPHGVQLKTTVNVCNLNTLQGFLFVLIAEAAQFPLHIHLQ